MTLHPDGPESASLRARVLFWGAALAVLAALRLPYLASPSYVLDNDEAVLGIMARHIAAGTELPLYFVGQNYGLAIFETLPAAMAFKLLGDGPRVLALTILVLFLLGLIPYALALRRLSGSERWARMLVLVLALLPGWIVWSMKARGLYVSGFVLTGCAVALLTRPMLSRRGLLGAGLLLGITGLVQPLWLTVAAPFLFLVRRERRDLALAGLLSVLVWLIPTVIGSSDEAFWQPRHLAGFTPERVSVVPRVLMAAFAGITEPHEPRPLAILVGILGTGAFFSLLAAAIADAVRRRSRTALAVSVGMALSVLHPVVLRVWVPRYFLPSTVLAVVAAAVWIGERSVPPRRTPLVGTLAVVVLLAFTATGLGRLPGKARPAVVPAEADLRALIRSLEADGVRGVYAPSADLQWQILFYGGERIPVRGRTGTDRYPEFARAVAEARRAGEPTALVADLRQLRRDYPSIDFFPGRRVGARYIRLDNPHALVRSIFGFQSVSTAAGNPR